MRGKNLIYAAAIVALSAQFAQGTEVVFSSEMLANPQDGKEPFWFNMVEPIDDVLPEGYTVVREHSGLAPIDPEGKTSGRFLTLRAPIAPETAPGLHVGLGVGRDKILRGETGASHALKLSIGMDLDLGEQTETYIEAQGLTGVGMSDMGGMEGTIKIGVRIFLN